MKLLLLLLPFWSLSWAQEEAAPPLKTRILDLEYPVELTDDTFEHETQASTGQTTGSWLVYIHGRPDSTIIYGDLPDPEMWTENHIVLATLDAATSYATKKRFQVTRLPAFLYIHNGKYYIHDKPPGGFTWNSLQRFALEDFNEQGGQGVPSVASKWDDMIEDILDILPPRDYFEKLGIAFAVMITLALGNQIHKRFIKKKDKKTKKD